MYIVQCTVSLDKWGGQCQEVGLNAQEREGGGRELAKTFCKILQRFCQNQDCFFGQKALAIYFSAEFTL